MNNLVVDKRFLMNLDRDIPRYLTPDEIHCLLENCDNKRNHVMFNMLWQCGCRISELLAVTRQDIDFNNRLIRFVTLKQQKRNRKSLKKIERMIPIQAELMAEISIFIAENSVEGKLFPFSRVQAFNILKQLAEKTGIGKIISPHSFRHSFAVNCLVQGVPLTVVSRLLGHSQISTTLVYLKIVMPDIKNLMLAVKF